MNERKDGKSRVTYQHALINCFNNGYLKALKDFEELLDNAKANHAGPEAPRHWDYELRDQIIQLRDELKTRP